ncbi:hypothetical protein [Actomonas aquatica]|uniref:Uncharacterized protein n=1 Tax=Actomonas aquatica TaxID=2866162 RepID=A0ABZ1C5X5_9BACT|nr:hypothetical protein [Opitutus sp. WL0086]WRQ87133.1 hypothetical protein K1X11_020160 [Opitutus sp. WL0086]
MLRILKQLFRRPPVRLGLIDEKRSFRSPVRSAGFVSFFNGSECVSRRYTDAHDHRLKRQRFFKTVVVLAITVMCTWFVIESAQAISSF